MQNMRLISLAANQDPLNSLELYGPVADLGIAQIRQGPQNAFEFPQQQQNYMALIDTGARNSSIDRTVADILKLPVIGPAVPGVGASGPFMSLPVMGLIRLPRLNAMAFGRFLTLPLIEHGQPYQAIIGRDFLRRAQFTYDGASGTWKMDLDSPTLRVAARQS